MVNKLLNLELPQEVWEMILDKKGLVPSKEFAEVMDQNMMNE